MLSRFFHVRSILKPFGLTAQPVLPATESIPAGGGVAAIHHADYDRHPLETRGFDHYVEWNEDDERFVVH